MGKVRVSGNRHTDRQTDKHPQMIKNYHIQNKRTAGRYTYKDLKQTDLHRNKHTHTHTHTLHFKQIHTHTLHFKLTHTHTLYTSNKYKHTHFTLQTNTHTHTHTHFKQTHTHTLIATPVHH